MCSPRDPNPCRGARQPHAAVRVRGHQVLPPCLPSDRSPPWGMRRRAPCTCIPQINTGGSFTGCFLVTLATQTRTPHWPRCKSPSSPPTCPSRALWCRLVPALGTARTCEAVAGAAHCPQGLRVSQGLPRVPPVLGYHLEGAECCGQELEQGQDRGSAPRTCEKRIFRLMFPV